MDTRNSEGMYAKDLAPEKLERLLKEGYTISPNSGRLRKRITSKRKRSPLSKRKVKKYTRIALWTLLILAFIVSLAIILPEMAIQNNPRNDYQKQQMRR